MKFLPTDEQDAIIKADLAPQCVIACPGSGKTATAVRRLAEVRKRIGDDRGYVALLSYSNTAVETFRREYKAITKKAPDLSTRVYIETVDSFLTSQILRPHGAVTMNAACQPFLVHGSERFLEGFKIFDGNRSYDITDLRVNWNGETFEYSLSSGYLQTPVEEWRVRKPIRDFAATGAYTHDLARLWVLNILKENTRLLRVLCRRFPHILIDEAQDIGSLHEALILLLAKHGSDISLIGDPNQSIYEFAGADGSFLKKYVNEPGVREFKLSQNRRSVRSIIDVANNLVNQNSGHFRENIDRMHGAFYLGYEDNDRAKVLEVFSNILDTKGYDAAEAVVVSRGHTAITKLTGDIGNIGQGGTRFFAQAAMQRDRNQDIASAYECAVNAIVRLLKNPPATLRRDLLNTRMGDDVKTLRRLMWTFLRNSHCGLPDSKLSARAEWHPKLRERIEILFSSLEAQTNYLRSPTWKRNLTNSKLSDSPLWQADLAAQDFPGIRVDTVHQVKGESIPAVLYLANVRDINNLLAGTGCEDGRIGYVAVTRAADLLLLAIPNTIDAAVVDAVEERGFKPWPT